MRRREFIAGIIPTGAGSAADVIPRIVFEAMSAQLGQPIIVENRPPLSLTGCGDHEANDDDQLFNLQTSSFLTKKSE